MRTLLLVPALAVAIVLLAGCAAQTSAAATPVETAQVSMPPSYRFDPPAIQVPVGTTVTWRNADHFTHSVNISGGAFPFLNLPPGQSGAITLTSRARTTTSAPTTPRICKAPSSSSRAKPGAQGRGVCQ